MFVDAGLSARLGKLTLDLSNVHLPAGSDTTRLPQGTATATAIE